jgi:phage major head subunit gpT-like protein
MNGRNYEYLFDARRKGMMQQRARSHWIRNYGDEGNVQDFAEDDLLRYGMTMAERIVGLGYGFWKSHLRYQRMLSLDGSWKSV